MKKAKKSPAKKDIANDVVELILKDHKPLKKLIKTLKSPETSASRKRPAFAEFAPLLHAHAKAEEQSLYMHMKGEKSLRSEAFEGDTEHSLADLLVEEVRSATDVDVWMAKVKVLAELVEHHIEEEEEEMLKSVRQELDADERAEIGEQYLSLYEQYSSESMAA